MKKTKFDLLLIATTDVESRAIIEIFKKETGHNPIPRQIKKQVFQDLGNINDSRVALVLTQMGSGGVAGSQESIRNGIDVLHPSAVVLVGIAFGINEGKQKIGDILVPQQLRLYDLQRIGKDKIILRGDKPHTSPWLFNYFRNAGFSWDKKRGRIITGVMLSGDKLVDNKKHRDRLLTLEPEAIGGEMEGAGLYVACKNSDVPWIIIKGICDWADGNKSVDTAVRQKIAAFNSSLFIVHALKMTPLISSNSNDHFLDSPHVFRDIASKSSQKIESIKRDNRVQLKDHSYSNLFQIVSLKIPYIVIFGGWKKNINEYRFGEVFCKIDDSFIYQLPEDFKVNNLQYENIYRGVEPKCRLMNYDCQITSGPQPNKLRFVFSKIEYQDYLMSGEHLDDPLPNNPSQTFREIYAPSFSMPNINQSKLTNITGVGIFILTSDNKIIISKHSQNVHVWSGIYSYSASGTMDWNQMLNPFDEISRECNEEIAHQINIDDTYLFAFGADAKKLYFQFSFFENTNLTSDDIINRAPQSRDYHAEMESIEPVPFELDSLIRIIKKYSWEPSAKAALLSLCTKHFGMNAVEQELDPKFVHVKLRRQMKIEWENRALRPGDLAVMSARYPFQRLAEESEKYCQSVIDFIGNDIFNKKIIEIGAGIGRLTKYLVKKAEKTTCIDFSKIMLQRNKAFIGENEKKVKYLNIFAQDFQPEEPNDIVISSLVLVHNDDDDFRQLVEAISKWAKIVFLFEHTDTGYQVSNQTHPRSEKELIRSFFNYDVAKRHEYTLFNDNLIFLKLVKKG